MDIVKADLTQILHVPLPGPLCHPVQLGLSQGVQIPVRVCVRLCGMSAFTIGSDPRGLSALGLCINMCVYFGYLSSSYYMLC